LRLLDSFVFFFIALAYCLALLYCNFFDPLMDESMAEAQLSNIPYIILPPRNFFGRMFQLFRRQKHPIKTQQRMGPVGAKEIVAVCARSIRGIKHLQSR